MEARAVVRKRRWDFGSRFRASAIAMFSVVLLLAGIAPASASSVNNGITYNDLVVVNYSGQAQVQFAPNLSEYGCLAGTATAAGFSYSPTIQTAITQHQDGLFDPGSQGLGTAANLLVTPPSGEKPNWAAMTLGFATRTNLPVNNTEDTGTGDASSNPDLPLTRVPGNSATVSCTLSLPCTGTEGFQFMKGTLNISPAGTTTMNNRNTYPLPISIYSGCALLINNPANQINPCTLPVPSDGELTDATMIATVGMPCFWYSVQETSVENFRQPFFKPTSYYTDDHYYVSINSVNGPGATSYANNLAAAGWYSYDSDAPGITQCGTMPNYIPKFVGYLEPNEEPDPSIFSCLTATLWEAGQKPCLLGPYPKQCPVLTGRSSRKSRQSPPPRWHDYFTRLANPSDPVVKSGKRLTVRTTLRVHPLMRKLLKKEHVTRTASLKVIARVDRNHALYKEAEQHVTLAPAKDGRVRLKVRFSKEDHRAIRAARTLGAVKLDINPWETVTTATEAFTYAPVEQLKLRKLR